MAVISYFMFTWLRNTHCLVLSTWKFVVDRKKRRQSVYERKVYNTCLAEIYNLSSQVEKTYDNQRLNFLFVLSTSRTITGNVLVSDNVDIYKISKTSDCISQAGKKKKK